MIIDTHTHLLDSGHWPAEWWDWVASDWASRRPDREPSMIRDRIEAGLIDPTGDRMIANMDRAGVDFSVILPIDWGPDFTGTLPITEVVDHAFAVAERHPRLIPFAGIDPRRAGAAAMVSEWFERGARGLKLYPSCGWDPGSSEAAEVYAVCAAQRRPVLFHTGHPLPVLDKERSNPMLLDEVARSFPDMPIWLGHAGAPEWWQEALEIAENHPNVRLELSVWLWDDSDEVAQVDFAKRVAEAGARVGYERLLFGTDHVSGAKVRADGFLDRVMSMYAALPDRIHRNGREVSADQMASLMGGNAASDLGLIP